MPQLEHESKLQHDIEMTMEIGVTQTSWGTDREKTCMRMVRESLMAGEKATEYQHGASNMQQLGPVQVPLHQEVGQAGHRRQFNNLHMHGCRSRGVWRGMDHSQWSQGQLKNSQKHQ